MAQRVIPGKVCIIPQKLQASYHIGTRMGEGKSTVPPGRIRYSGIAVASTDSQPEREAFTPRIVALTGFMGAGKTQVGRALARLLGWSFVDLDEEIELSHKLPIREIFQLQGEPQFREIETETLRRIVAWISGPTVIALGGGTFIQATNAALLRASDASVVFLDTPIEDMLQRCWLDPQTTPDNLRPLAADPDAFRTLYAERLPRYRDADLAVNTSGRTVEENAREIASRLQIAPHQ